MAEGAEEVLMIFLHKEELMVGGSITPSGLSCTARNYPVSDYMLYGFGGLVTGQTGLGQISVLFLGAVYILI